MSEIQANKYVLCKYDQNYYIGIIMEHFKENCECEVKFMTPKFSQTASYSWPLCDDICYVPLENMICIVDIYTPTGCQYLLTEQCKKDVIDLLN